MDHRLEDALAESFSHLDGADTPPTLARALRHAVFPGGARVRPRLCLAVAAACGDDAPRLSAGAAAALELLHCASLVHDDLPCFDDADTRRGRPSVHHAFGEPLAVLVGDALIVAAFETVTRRSLEAPTRLAPLLLTLSSAAGAARGLVAGQAWESESRVDVECYHRAKTGSLFTAATECGARAAGADPAPWRILGERLGAAYQVADDLRDALSDPDELGKPARKDAELHRPSAVAELGAAGAEARLGLLLREAMDSVPACPGQAALRSLVRAQGARLWPVVRRESAA